MNKLWCIASILNIGNLCGVTSIDVSQQLDPETPISIILKVDVHNTNNAYNGSYKHKCHNYFGTQLKECILCLPQEEMCEIFLELSDHEQYQIYEKASTSERCILAHSFQDDVSWHNWRHTQSFKMQQLFPESRHDACKVSLIKKVAIAGSTGAGALAALAYAAQLCLKQKPHEQKFSCSVKGTHNPAKSWKVS